MIARLARKGPPGEARRRTRGAPRTLVLPERMQIRRAARAWGRTPTTFARLARTYRVPVEVIRALVMG
jgi:hypothetical protein